MKNPPWQRDELILALDLYFSKKYNELNRKHNDVVELSKILNKLPIFSETQRTVTFRNPEGVYMKLGNFLAIDPTDSREGLPGYGKLDKIIFHEFVNSKQELSFIAKAIKESLSNSETLKLINISSSEENIEEWSIKEGKIIYRIHKHRERNATIIKKKKKQALQKTGKLECEVCGFNFEVHYGKLGEGFIECHHTKPISKTYLEDKTELKDLALLCSNCHRMIHRDLNLTIEDLKKLLLLSIH